jgi:hypothetical protein
MPRREKQELEETQLEREEEEQLSGLWRTLWGEEVVHRKLVIGLRDVGLTFTT